MHMAGFRIGPDDCVNYLFEPWTLDSKGAFAGAVVATFILAVGTEALTWFRREVMCKCTPLVHRPRTHRAAMGLLFMTQVTLGYVLMLIAMTYQAELFIAVVVGLTLGHTALNVKAPVSERSGDACCVTAVVSAHSADRQTRTSNAVPEPHPSECCTAKGIADGEETAAAQARKIPMLSVDTINA